MKRYVFIFVALMGLLILVASTQAASIDVTLYANSEQNVTFSDGGGMYFDDWRIWKNDGGSPAIADEKAGATNIGDVSVSEGTLVGSADKHLFTYTAADAEDGSGATNFGSAFKLCGGFNTPVWVSFSVSDIGAAGVLRVYSGGWADGNTLDAVIGSDSLSVTRPWAGNDYADWWEIEYSGVTDTQATLDITMTTIDVEYNDMQFYSAALDVVPEPSALAMLVAGAFGLAWFGRRRNR